MDKIKGRLQNESHNVNKALTNRMAGKMSASTKQDTCIISASLTHLDNIELGFWIIDSRATAHMCIDIKQMCDITTIANPIIVNLPDGSTKNVTKIGNVRLTTKLILNEVLYTPYFEFNLMSVNKAAKHSTVKFIFLTMAYCKT